MPIFPLEPFLQPLANNPWTYLVFGLVGFAFGYVLEISGFGNSKKLAAQFYFKDLTVLKVMFTAIVVAMVLIFFSVGIGLLDFSKVWVNPTYFGPGIVGGLIMGVGFIIGGFCPGTSLVSASTLKLDGIAFALGTVFGVWAFGETVDWYWQWWNTGGYLGRLTFMDLLNVPSGVVVVAVVLMALFMFWGGEQLERIIGKKDLSAEPKKRKYAALALFGGAVAVLIITSPFLVNLNKPEGLIVEDTQAVSRWKLVAAEKEQVLANREVQIHPGELLASLADDRLQIVMLDARTESDYNLFHLEGARRVDPGDLLNLANDFVATFSPNTVYVVMSNDEAAATEVWKVLEAKSVPNVYILEGGVNEWISIFGADDPQITPTPTPPGSDVLSYSFAAALGDRYHASFPSAHEYEIEFTPKIKLELKRDKSGGGCG
jgi:hypothetical protein